MCGLSAHWTAEGQIPIDPILSRPKQKQLLQAIAKDKKAENITSAAFIKKHRLTSASSVQAAMKPLLKNDIITCEDGAYRVSDYFFSAYLAMSCTGA